MRKSSRIHYLLVVTTEPFIIVRTPYPIPGKWREFCSKMVMIMNFQMNTTKFKMSDISSIEGFNTNEKEDGYEPNFIKRLEGAFLGEEDKVPRFWLYDWKDGEFTLIRKGKE